MNSRPKREPRFGFATTVVEARRLIAADRIAIFAGLEGADEIQSLDDVDLLFARGVRAIGPVHFGDNDLAEAEEGQFGPIGRVVLEGRVEGLTRLGQEIVTRMMELGMVVDIAHAHPRTAEQVLTLAEARGVAVMASHAGSAMAAPRTLADPIAARVARLGGLIGVGLFRHPMLQPIPSGERWPGFTDGTCDEVIAHFSHYTRVAGPASVALGSDFNSPILRPKPGPRCPNGIRSTRDLPFLVRALEASGVPHDLASSVDRVLELFERAEVAADPRAVAEARGGGRRRDDSPFDAPLGTPTGEPRSR